MRTTLTAALAAALLTLAACASSGDDATDETAVEDPAVDAVADDGDAGAVLVAGFRFQPATIEVPVGTAVTWSNEDNIRHTATAGTPEAPEDTFDVDLPEVGSSGSHTFDEPGTYPYFCEVHTSMTGEVVVTG